jgi:long-chain acyl-CoA synthetase
LEAAQTTAETLKDGWVYTGDIGYFDSKDFIFLVDRSKDLIISGAFNIYPDEVEKVIVTHPAVKEVVVIGVPNQKWGEAVKAVVLLKQSANVFEQELIEYRRERGLGFKRPEFLILLMRFPETLTEKSIKMLCANRAGKVLKGRFTRGSL